MGTKNKPRRLALLLIFGIATIAGTLGYLRYIATFRFWMPPPAGSGPAGPIVAKGTFQNVWTKRQVVLLGVGDSVTAGFGATPGHSYFERIVSNPDDEFSDIDGTCLRNVIPNLKPMNISVSGSDSLQHLAEQMEPLKPFPDDTQGIVVMTSGGNDIIHWYGRGTPKEGAMYGASREQASPWVENFHKRLDAMLDKINTAFPGGCHVFLATIYDPSDGVGNPAAAGLPPWPDMLTIHDKYNQIIRNAAAARGNVHLVDLHREFLGHGVHCVQWWRDHYRSEDPHYWYFTNLEDPNDRGYDAIRRLFLIEMQRVLPKAIEDEQNKLG